MSKPATLGLFVTLSGAWEENVTLDFATQAMDDCAFGSFVCAETETVFFQDFDGTKLALWRPNPA